MAPKIDCPLYFLLAFVARTRISKIVIPSRQYFVIFLVHAFELKEVKKW